MKPVNEWKIAAYCVRRQRVSREISYFWMKHGTIFRFEFVVSIYIDGFIIRWMEYLSVGKGKYSRHYFVLTSSSTSCFIKVLF